MALDYAALRAAYQEHFAGQPRVFRAPGRVNLIGEHTDYNEGYVFPVAMDREVCFCVRPRDDRRIRLVALDLERAEEEFSLDALAWTPAGYWTNYVKAMAKAFEEAGYPCCGFEGVVAGDVPIAGGVSSSSAFTVAAATAFERLAGIDVDENQLILLTQVAENSATGLRGGIMDQFTARRGKRDHALLIDCRSMEYELVPMPPVTIVVIDTKRPRELATTAYNIRRAEGEEGAAVVARTVPGVKALRDVTSAQLEARRGDMLDTVYKRSRHVVTENARVLECVKVLKAGDLRGLGQLVTESHVSLRDDYKVSCDELDVVVALAWDTPGVYGARMVGAGFGGCAIALCDEAAVPALQARIAAEYPRRCGLTAEVYATRAGNGAGEVG
ncbi:MAG: galactokinase [Armatimonadetes bacterium]|nr:galactokinase [Armatimonadota bacterium]